MSKRRGYVVERIRKRRCAHGACSEYGRVAIHLPLSDIGPDDTPGVAKIPLCPEHLSWSVLEFTKLENLKARDQEGV